MEDFLHPHWHVNWCCILQGLCRWPHCWDFIGAASVLEIWLCSDGIISLLSIVGIHFFFQIPPLILNNVMMQNLGYKSDYPSLYFCTVNSWEGVIESGHTNIERTLGAGVLIAFQISCPKWWHLFTHGVSSFARLNIVSCWTFHLENCLSCVLLVVWLNTQKVSWKLFEVWPDRKGGKTQREQKP